MWKTIYVLLQASSFAITLSIHISAARSESLGVYPDSTTQTEIISNSDRCLSDCTVSGGVQRGESLLHSFTRFSIPEATTVTFLENGANNIFIRVRDEASVVNGRLAVEGTNSANVFLVNPRGITFGASSSIAIGGSFVATTAESVLFPGDVQFSAADEHIPLLTIGTPTGLRFGETPGSIVNQSQSSLRGIINTFGEPAGLQVKPGKTLSLFGGDVISSNGSLTANGGRVFIGSMGARSSVTLSTDLTPVYESDVSFQDIYITERSIVDVSGEGGKVFIRGRNASILNNAFIGNSASGSSVGNIDIEADENIVIQNGGLSFSTLSGEFISGTDLKLVSNTLTLDDGAIISGGTLGESDGGQITIDAADSVNIRGGGEFLPSLITTSSAGSGQGGDITINTNNLYISEGAQVQAIAFGSGPGGDIYINANEQIDINGSIETPLGTFASGIVASSGIENSPILPIGQGGSLAIRADALTLTDGAQIAVNSFGTGNSGDIDIRAQSVHLDNSAQLTAAAILGNGGNISLSGLETLILRRGSVISTQAGDQGSVGNGGNIDIVADFIISRPMEDSDIVAKAREGSGGNITIETRGLYGFEERIASVGNGTNDIDASSELGTSGTTAINRVVSDTGVVTTSIGEYVLEASVEVSQGCGAVGNRLVRTGRGGVPRQPSEMLEYRESLSDLGENRATNSPVDQSYSSRYRDREEHVVDTVVAERISTNGTVAEAISTVPILIEANGWRRDSNNQIRLLTQQRDVSVGSMAYCTS